MSTGMHNVVISGVPPRPFSPTTPRSLAGLIPSVQSIAPRGRNTSETRRLCISWGSMCSASSAHSLLRAELLKSESTSGPLVYH